MTILNIDRIITFLRLGENAEDPHTAMESIERAVVFRGTNVLILIFAILIASVGLNVNSAAVVIGAMLISPLMGPIVGVGAGLGVMDLALVRRALKNLGFAVGASLVTSTLYFMISPLSEAHSEILARTSPTIWDVLIALAGGFAGIVATASKERGNVVPGVAIATALMPPLCTAGYGLAHLNWSFFAGAMYLFVINSVFISIAALATVRWLNYPTVHWEQESVKRRIRRITTVIVLATVAPSVYLAYRLVLQNAFQQKAEQFITNEATMPLNYLVQRNIDPVARTISLTYMGSGLSQEQETRMRERLSIYGIADCRLAVRTGLSLLELGREEQNADMDRQAELERQRAIETRLAGLKDSIHSARVNADLLFTEAHAVHPGLQWLVVSDPPTSIDRDSIGKIVSARFTVEPDTSAIAQLDRWLAVKLQGTRHTLVVSAAEKSPAAKRKELR